MFGVGPLELIIVVVIALVIFGPKRLPEITRSVGDGIRELKSTVSTVDPREELKSTLESTDQGEDRDIERRA